MIEAYFSLGSNLGDRKQNLTSAIALMEKAFGLKVFRISEIIETEPVGFVSDNLFLNCALRFDFPEAGQDPQLHCRSILSACKAIEKQLGRETKTLHGEDGHRIYASRPIDIDILLYGDFQLKSEDLTVPHAEMFHRSFVLIPLREIASDKLIRSFPQIME